MDVCALCTVSLAILRIVQRFSHCLLSFQRLLLSCHSLVTFSFIDMWPGHLLLSVKTVKRIFLKTFVLSDLSYEYNSLRQTFYHLSPYPLVSCFRVLFYRDNLSHNVHYCLEYIPQLLCNASVFSILFKQFFVAMFMPYCILLSFWFDIPRMYVIVNFFG